MPDPLRSLIEESGDSIIEYAGDHLEQEEENPFHLIPERAARLIILYVVVEH